MKTAKKAHADEEPGYAQAPVSVVHEPAQTIEDQIAQQEAIIAEAHQRIHRLLHPFVEFPKMVKGRVFASREEQDKAGPAFADGAK